MKKPEKELSVNLNSFPKVESHYTRKDTTKLYIQDTSNFGKLTVSRMHELYQQEIDGENKDKVENKVVVGYIYIYISGAYLAFFLGYIIPHETATFPPGFPPIPVQGSLEFRINGGRGGGGGGTY